MRCLVFPIARAVMVILAVGADGITTVEITLNVQQHYATVPIAWPSVSCLKWIGPMPSKPFWPESHN